jgi:hypothetical protein
MKMKTVPIILCFLSLANCQAQWVQLSGTQGGIWSLTVNGSFIFAGSDSGGVYLSTNDGLNWTQTSLNNQWVLSLTASGSNVFAGTNGHGIYQSTNNGMNWTQTTLNFGGVLNIVINGQNIFAGGSMGVYLSTDFGQTWTPSSLGSLTVYAIVINGSDIFAGVVTYGVYKSTNMGGNWTPTSLNNRTIHSLSTDGNIIFAGTDPYGIYISTNNGLNWTNTLGNQVVYSLPLIGCNIFAATLYNGVFLSTNNGLNWTQRNEGMGNRTVRSLALSQNFIYAGTLGYSVWRRPLSELVGINGVSADVAEIFSLSQNYPNPFNPTTKIQFSIPPSKGVRGMGVILFIYDVLGREVSTLVNQHLKPGNYEVEWDGSNFPSGVYFYKLATGSFSETKKMILLK